MSTRPGRFWLGLLAAFVIGLWLVSEVLLPFVLGMAIGYLLDPLVERLEHRGVSRAAAAAVMVATAYSIGIAGILVLAPLLVRQSIDLASKVPDYTRAAYDTLSPLLHRVLATSGSARAGDLVAAAAQRVTDVLGPLATGLVGRGLAVVNVLFMLAITPIVAFYLLRDWPKLVAEIDDWLPRDHAETIRTEARAVDAVLAGFARGTAIVCATLAVYYAIALTLAGLQSGLAIGLVAGSVSFVPYLGTLGGAAAAVTVAAFQFWPQWEPIAIVFGIFVVGQLLNDYVLTPNLVGDKVGLHPLWVLFALLAGGALLGFSGVVIAVPVAAVIGVLARFAIARYKQSDLYRGRDAYPG